jgi:GYF domain 2
MQETYFQQSQNRDIGPLNANQIRQRIRSGQLQPSDKIRVGGEAFGYPAIEFLDFRDELERTAAQESNSRRWVCLRTKRAVRGSTEAMCGPYTRKDIVNLLMRGDLRATDLVWREGFTSWKSLDSVEQLQLPVPGFSQKLIPWNTGTLDWGDTARSRPKPRPVAQTNVLVDYALNGALVLICGLLAWVVWQLAFSHHRVAAIQPKFARPAVSAVAKSGAIKYSKAPRAKVIDQRVRRL